MKPPRLSHNPFVTIVRSLAVALSAWALCTSLAQAQVLFYSSAGTQGTINRTSAASTSLSNLVSYGGGVNVQGIAVQNSTGDVYASVTNGATRTINRITSAGVSTTFATLTNSAAGITFSSSGTLYGVQIGGGPSGGNTIGIYTAGGFTSLNITGTPFAPFFSAQSLRFDANGNIFVTNSSSGGVYANSVVKLTYNIGLGSWDTSKFADTAGFAAYDIAFDLLGNVYVSSSSTSAAVPIRKYSAAGVLDNTFAVTGGNVVTPRGLAFTNGFLYETDYSSQRINQIDPATGAATVFASTANFNQTYLAVVPEPSVTMLMLASGLGLIVYRVARRRSSRSLVC